MSRPKGTTICSSDSAWTVVRGQPSSTKPRPVVSRSERRPPTISITISSGISSPWSISWAARVPSDERDFTSLRSMSPVDTCGTT